MLNPRSPFTILLLLLTGLYSALFGWFLFGELGGVDGLALANGNPAGGDFINLWAASQLLGMDRAAEIYDPAALLAFEEGLVGGEIGLRLWAYPPHSLFLAEVFSPFSYFAALALWSALGLIVLGFGLWRLGHGWPMVVIGLLSPASWQCLYFGQTGNLAAGLLLVALTARSGRDGMSALSAAALTVKPQFGLLLPVVWLARRYFALIALTVVLVVVAVAAALVVYGPDVWVDYVIKTVPVLSALEASGTGAFMQMIPSVFMSLRVLGVEGGPALTAHLVVAALVLTASGVALFRRDDRVGQWAICLIATSLITPYLHTYDMGLLLAGALLLVPYARSLVVHLLVLTVWALPHVLFDLNATGWPVAPLILLGLFGCALTQKEGRVAPAS